MNRYRRNGLTVIEVLTAIVVALIGVAGVMVMIPFAVEQAEIGFDQETAYRLGANFANEFEMKGFTDPDRWYVSTAGNSVANRTARNYVIDPMGAADLNAAGVAGEGLFPFVRDTDNDGIPDVLETLPAATADWGIFIERVNLKRLPLPTPPTLPTPFDLDLARHHMTWRDDLQVVEPLNPSVGYPSPDVAPPLQVFDKGGVADVRRQALGEMSVMVVTVPADIVQTTLNNPPPGVNYDYPFSGDPNNDARDAVREFRNYFVVSKRRPRVVAGAANQPFDRLYQVDHPYSAAANYDIDPDANPANGLANARLRMAHGGGTLIFREETGGVLGNNDLLTANNWSTQRREIRRGDWVALTNVTYNYTSNRFVQQINFYQVDDANYVTGAQNYWTVTLRGPDFDFGWQYTNATTPLPTQTYGNFGPFLASYNTGTGEVIPSRTYAIHLPDVWAVFEKTYRK